MCASFITLLLTLCLADKYRGLIASTGQSFAMLSGTSMATPHIAGVAALLKQKHPDWDVSSIRSAILTTASQRDSKSRLLRAQQPSLNASTAVGQGSPFDYGFGAVNATAALDPGLVFKTGILVMPISAFKRIRPLKAIKCATKLCVRNLQGVNYLIHSLCLSLSWEPFWL
jgi:hypothetical protein